ncbi:MAG: hypothetical protein P4L51_01015 [Puia sp.]|nr:hypothetical protein [Puia sp.]
MRSIKSAKKTGKKVDKKQVKSEGMQQSSEAAVLTQTLISQGSLCGVGIPGLSR